LTSANNTQDSPGNAPFALSGTNGTGVLTNSTATVLFARAVLLNRPHSQHDQPCLLPEGAEAALDGFYAQAFELIGTSIPLTLK